MITFTPLLINEFKYPDSNEARRILNDFVHKDEYTQETHNEMKAMYENLGTFDFRKWHQEKMKQFEGIVCGYFHYYQNVYGFSYILFMKLEIHTASRLLNIWRKQQSS